MTVFCFGCPRVHLCVNSWAVWGLFEKLLVQIGVGNKVPRHAFCSFSNQIMEATKDVLFYASLARSVAPHRLCPCSLENRKHLCPVTIFIHPTRHSTGDRQRLRGFAVPLNLVLVICVLIVECRQGSVLLFGECGGVCECVVLAE